jgi:hypothetical protein
MTGKTVTFSLGSDKELEDYLESIKINSSEWIRDTIRQRMLDGIDSKRASRVSYQQKLLTIRSLTAEAEAERQAYKEKYGTDIDADSETENLEQDRQQAENDGVIKRAWDKLDEACVSSRVLNDAELRSEVREEIAELRRLGQPQKEISKRINTHIEQAKVRVAAEEEDQRKAEAEQKRAQEEQIRVDREIRRLAKELMQPWEAKHPEPAEETSQHKAWIEARRKALREAKEKAKEEQRRTQDAANGGAHE